MSKFIATAEIIGECKYDESGVNKVITNHKGEIKTRTWIKTIIITPDEQYVNLTDSNNNLDKLYQGIEITNSDTNYDNVFNDCYEKACEHFNNFTVEGYTILGYKLKEIKELNLPID